MKESKQMKKLTIAASATKLSDGLKVRVNMR